MIAVLLRLERISGDAQASASVLVFLDLVDELRNRPVLQLQALVRLGEILSRLDVVGFLRERCDASIDGERSYAERRP